MDVQIRASDRWIRTRQASDSASLRRCYVATGNASSVWRQALYLKLESRCNYSPARRGPGTSATSAALANALRTNCERNGLARPL